MKLARIPAVKVDVTVEKEVEQADGEDVRTAEVAKVISKSEKAVLTQVINPNLAEGADEEMKDHRMPALEDVEEEKYNLYFFVENNQKERDG